jgi:hypothetical protein
MLILIDPRKTADELRDQAGKLGVPPDFLETMVHDGYILPVGNVAPAVVGGATAVPGSTAAAAPTATDAGDAGDAQAPAADPGVAVPSDEFAKFREAKTFMNETVVTALGIRAFMFTLRLERCSNRADLAALFPDYEKAIRKGAGEADAQVLTANLRELLG